MPIVACLLCSILVWRLVENKKGSLIKVFLVNMLLSALIYSYYIGYSVNVLKAAFLRNSPNAVYFSAISVIAAVLMCVVEFYNKHKKEIYSGSVDYHIESKDRKIFWLIVLLAFLVRIIGVNWGAGQTFHPDEGKVVRPPIYMAENSTFMSDELEAPSQITSRVLSIVFKLVMIIGDLLNTEISTLIYVVITRTYMAILSVGVVVSIFFIGNHLKKHAGTVAAALTAFFPPFIHAAHCAENDTFVGLCICVCTLCAFHYLEEDRDFKWLLSMAFVTVLATFDKWHGMVTCATIAIAICVKQICHKRYMNIIIHGGFSILAIMVVTGLLVPNLVVNVKDIAKTLTHLTNDYATENSATFSQNIYTYIVWFFSHMGVISSVFLAVGVICAIRDKSIEFVLLAVGLIEIIGICLQDRHFIRWGYPFYAVLIISIGVGVSYVYEKANDSNRIGGKIVFGVSIALTLLNLLAGTVLLDVMYTNSQLDTRVVSEKWCLDRGVAQFDCVYDPYTCWEPGGIVINYPYRYESQISINATMEKTDSGVVINRIGRQYAVTHPNENTRYLMEQSRAVEIAYFEAYCIFNDNGFGDFGNIPYRVLEPSRIWFCMNKCIGILQKGMSFGRDDIAIYDISMVPSYEKCIYMDYDSEEKVYWGRIDKIPQGILNVEVSGEEIENGHLYIEDADGVTVASFDFIDGHTEFFMGMDCYLLTVKADQKFDYIKFWTDN